MGDMREVFDDMKAASLAIRSEKEPQRFAYAKQKLAAAGHTITDVKDDHSCFMVNGYIKFWPYTGWFAGKGIGSGRGIHTLLKKLEAKK